MNANAYTSNHYVPQWYQRPFLPTVGEQKLFYLDLQPGSSRDRYGRVHPHDGLHRWGTKRCFQEDDLYTTRFGQWESREIEERFFGQVDSDGRDALNFIANFDHLRLDSDAFHQLLLYMSLQKLRTPKGLGYLASMVGSADKNIALAAMQQFQALHCVSWTEGVWALLDANRSETKFIISDHPVTVYNRDCFPASARCRGFLDPEVWRVGTHTLFPLTPTRLLVITNLSWVRNPYQRADVLRPNPSPFRPARLFDWRTVQIGRELTAEEVNQVNFIIKKRAHRFIAAGAEPWLYPEKRIPSEHWRKLDDRYLLMPDPRSILFSGEIVVGFADDRPAYRVDAHGRVPSQRGYGQYKHERAAAYRFKGEFARVFGPRRRGRTFAMNRLDPEEDSADFHQYHLDLEGRSGSIRQRRARRRAR